MPTDGDLFGPIVTTDELLAATSGRAWLQAMLDVEAALAGAQADTGIVPRQAAAGIAESCVADRFDPAELARSARLGGNPVIPLVHALSASVPADARRWVHLGATSQDILDSAAMLIVRRALLPLRRDLAGLAGGCADLAERHRDTLMAGRTLLQQALPITFGLKAAGWLVAAMDVSAQVVQADSRLAAQLGGAAGTLASLGADGPAVAAQFSRRLGLAEPMLPWHTSRQRVAEAAAALGQATGTAAKIAMDVALLMQTEVAEVSEPALPGRGSSSTLPHKRNPVGAAAVSAAARRAHGLLPVIYGAMIQEHERAVGGWQAEWQTLTELLQLAGGAVARVRETIEGLEIDVVRMRDNLDLTRGLLMAERVTMALSEVMDPAVARQAVQTAGHRVSGSGRSFGAELRDEPALSEALASMDLDRLLDPAGYLGATATFIDRALEAHRDSAR